MGYILVVDDDENSRTLLQSLLSLSGWEVKAAADGSEALNLVQQEAPLLILLDLMMPRKSGFHVLTELRGSTTTRTIPVIVVSSLATPSSDISLLPGVVGVLQKGTFTLRDLQATIAPILKPPVKSDGHADEPASS